MAERKSGAGARLSGVLERQTPADRPAELDEGEVDPLPEPVDVEPAGDAARGRAGVTAPKGKAVDARKAKRIKGRTIYLPDDLFERILVQAHRRGKTISEYVAAVLDRNVPDHRRVRADGGEPGQAGAA